MQNRNHSSGYIWEQALPPASGSPRIRHGSHTCPMPLCRHSPGHAQGSRNSSSCRRCIFRSHRWGSSSWDLFQAEVRPELEQVAKQRHSCWWRCARAFLSSAASGQAWCPALPTWPHKGPRAVSFQIHGLCDSSSQVLSHIQVQCGSGVGTPKLEG